MNGTFRIIDRNTGQPINVAVAGSEKIIHIGAHSFKPEEFFKGVQQILMSSDLGDGECPFRKFRKEVSEMQEGEGKSLGAKRLRPSTERLLAGTRAPN